MLSTLTPLNLFLTKGFVYTCAPWNSKVPILTLILQWISKKTWFWWPTYIFSCYIWHHTALIIWAWVYKVCSEALLVDSNWCGIPLNCSTVYLLGGQLIALASAKGWNVTVITFVGSDIQKIRIEDAPRPHLEWGYFICWVHHLLVKIDININMICFMHILWMY